MTKPTRATARPSKGFTGTRGKPLMKPKGWDGTAGDKARIETLRAAAKGTYGIVSAAAACDRSLGKVTAFTVLALLGKYRNAVTTECFPSHATLARRLGIDRRSVQRHIDKLVERGYLVILPRRGPRGQMSNAYVVLFPAMPEIEEEVEKDEHLQAEQEGSTRRVAGGATLDVAGGGVETENSPDPLRHGVSDPATRGDDPCDTACRTNGPTSNGPNLNGPPAEAGALPRAAAAAAHEGDGHVGKEKTPEQQARLDRLIEDTSQIAAAARTSFGAVRERMHRWRDDLAAAGLPRLDAALFIADVALEVPKTDVALDAMAGRIAERLQVLRDMQEMVP